jgi:hypothetical protein
MKITKESKLAINKIMNDAYPEIFKRGYAKGWRVGNKHGLNLFCKRAEKNFDWGEWDRDPTSPPPKNETKDAWGDFLRGKRAIKK